MACSRKTIARGCFGKIYKEKFNGTWAAMKKVPMGIISKKQLEGECKVYHSARHCHVVKLLGDPWLQDGRWHIPLEFIKGEDLETTIFKVQESKVQLTPKVKATIITGMCEGLFHLHSKNIVHQDLKPDNIMVEHGTHRAVIIDMGLAKFSFNGFSSAQNCGNVAYSAPEILQGNGVRDKRSDVWAMGKIITELITGVRQSSNLASPTIREMLKDSPYCNVVSKMVATNPSERASMAEMIIEIRHLSVGIHLGIDMLAKPKAGTGQAKLGLVAHDGPRRTGPVPVPIRVFVSEFFKVPILCPLPPNGTVTHLHFDDESGQLVIKQIFMRNGNIVKHENMKIRKS
ncbi:spindle assembly checkpoint kinase-like [Colossoma macropomum]|uniref:spindle assembly checkpoint kinase-like n=1 Tax=Colossoma macropomum TaxID=42526 RepID=UPI001864BF23|nr:spindle assembly checkpoint kinase-like [Colossoma macropomum]